MALHYGLFNDSFPPTIDGVASVTLNYAEILQQQYGAATVATPYYPNIKDKYAFEVVRYPSVYLGDAVGYRAGFPFDPKVLYTLEKQRIDIIHSHCPFVSTMLARVLRSATGAPVVFTYHTKFDIDIDNVTESKSLRKASRRFIVENISACDDVWVVSEGAGQNLRSLGYEGDYIVMENGTDFERRRSLPARTDKLLRELNITEGEPVFLFVGRMMWYKGLRLSLDALKRLADRGQAFRFVVVGDGAEAADIRDYTGKIGLAERCAFIGAVHDREQLRDYYSIADLFLFPSDFDTNGIVVREAAACGCPSLLLRGSAAAEGITDGRTGILIDKDADAMARALIESCADRNRLKMIGETAAQEIYLSWEDAVAKAHGRYLEVLDRGTTHLHRDPSIRQAHRDIADTLAHILDDFGETSGRLAEMLADARGWIERSLVENDEQ